MYSSTVLACVSRSKMILFRASDPTVVSGVRPRATAAPADTTVVFQLCTSAEAGASSGPSGAGR